MVDLTRHRDKDGSLVVRARLLDLVPGCSGQADKARLAERDEAFPAGVEIATMTRSRTCRRVNVVRSGQSKVAGDTSRSSRWAA